MPSAPHESATGSMTREQSRAATRAAILDSAESHFLAKGYRGARLDEIAESAGYSKGAIYSNFTSKDELFLAVSSARGDRTAQPLLDALEGDGDADAKLEAFAGWLRSMSDLDNEWILLETEFTLIERRDPVVAATLQARYRQGLTDVTTVIAEQLRALGITPTVDAEVIAETMMALQSGLALSHAVDPGVGPRNLTGVLRALIGFTAT